MIEIIFWLYFVNTIFVLIHELQGTYVKEWYYFKPPKKYSETTLYNFYVYAHIPLFFALILGLVKLSHQSGLIYSLIFSGFIIFHYFIHISAIKKGKKELDNPASKNILRVTLLVSLIQFPLTIKVLFF